MRIIPSLSSAVAAISDAIGQSIKTCSFVFILVTLAPTLGLAASYTFEKIHSSPPPNVQSGTIAINNDGSVCYLDFPASGPSTLNRDLYIGKVGSAPVNVTNGFKSFNSVEIGGINSSGVVVFIGNLLDSTATTQTFLYTASRAGAPSLLASSTDSDPNDIFLSVVGSHPSINDSGDVVYNLNAKIMEASGGNTHMVLDNAPLSYLGGTASRLGNVNSKGVIALLDFNNAGVPGVYAVTNQSRVPYAEKAGLYYAAFTPSINNSGAIVFATTTSPTDATINVKLATPSGVSTIYTGTGVLSLAPPSINNNGDVLMKGVSSLFVGSDPLAGKVIAVGDALFGGTVAYVESSPSPNSSARTINDLGQIAFRYALTSGESGVAVATPSGLPAIPTNGVQSAGGFGTFSSVAAGSWIEIYGTNLAATTRQWAGGDFSNGVAPTTLDGVTVAVAGQPAFIDYVSSTQVNALLPSSLATGPALLVLTTPSGATVSAQVTVAATDPGILAPPSLVVNGVQYAGALFSDGTTFAMPQGAIVGVPSRPAKPGDTLVLYGIGFGPVTGGLTAGTVVTQSNSLLSPVEIDVAGIPAQVSYFGLAPGYTGLYQFNFTVPNVADSNVVPLTVKLGNVPASQKLNIAVHQ